MSETEHRPWTPAEDSILGKMKGRFDISHIAMRLSREASDVSERIDYLEEVVKNKKELQYAAQHTEDGQMDAAFMLYSNICLVYNDLGEQLRAFADILSQQVEWAELNDYLYRNSDAIEAQADRNHEERSSVLASTILDDFIVIRRTKATLQTCGCGEECDHKKGEGDANAETQ